MLRPAHPFGADIDVQVAAILKEILEKQMEHPAVIRPSQHADWRTDRMGKSTLFESPRLLVGLNAFEPGQFHALHAHARMDKLYHVVEGEGVLLLDGRELPIKAGQLVVAPEGVQHGIRNTSGQRLLVLAILAPAP
jgi:mannose-6-phosphate isomerase-like protein (cupin superfamily)